MSDVSVESLSFAITVIECHSSRNQQKKLITTSPVDDAKSRASAAATCRSTASAIAIDQQQEKFPTREIINV
jgi:hypothetical protein